MPGVLTVHDAGAERCVVVEARAVVGRDADCDVVLSSRSVSRKHAIVERRGEGWVVRDLGSANGLFVEGKRVSEAPLVSGASVSRRDGTVFLRKAGMEIDLGGVGKEYAVDRAAGVLREAGVPSAIVEFAGDVRTVGSRGDGRPWRVGVAHPRRGGKVARWNNETKAEDPVSDEQRGSIFSGITLLRHDLPDTGAQSLG